MKCSVMSLFLSLLIWISVGLYVGGGYTALSQTLDLLAKYGPIKGRGNPALDDMQVNPETQQYNPMYPTTPGNRVPQIFAGIQYFLIAWAIYMGINSIVFIFDSVRNKKAISNKSYQGSRTSDSAISCTAWLVGYCILLALMWFIQCCFCVLPILEFRITMQRCWDLDNPYFSSAADQNICVDLVQYGLVMYKDTGDEGYALICGPGGNYPQQRGDLRGFCENYYPTFAAYLIAFAGASIGLITMIFFAIHHSSNFAYLKIRRYEGPVARAPRSPNKSPTKGRARRNRQPKTISERSHAMELASHPSFHQGYAYEQPIRQNGVNLYNPNYGSSVIMAREDMPKAVPEVMSFQRYHADDEDDEVQTIISAKEKEMKYYPADTDEEERGRYSPNSHRTDDRLIPYRHTPSPPPYTHEIDDRAAGEYGSDEYDGDRRERTGRRHRDRDQERSSRSRSDASGGRRKHRRPSSDESTSAAHSSSHRAYPSAAARKSRRYRRRISDDDNTRATSDDEHRSRTSSRRRRDRDRRERKYEDDESSPPSDFYMDEDIHRRKSRDRY